MPYFINSTKEEITTKAGGNFFKFAPGQIKYIKNDDIAHFIATEKRDCGLALLPSTYEEDLDWRTSEEGKATIAALQEAALKEYIKKHRSVIENNQVALRKDLARANLQQDPSTEITDGEFNSMRIVAKYARAEEDTEAAKQAEVKRLMDQIKKVK